jgi:hypothetical protein
LEHVSDAVPKSLIARIDPHHSKAAAGNVNSMRSRIVALAGGAATPGPESVLAETKTPPKAKKKSKSEEDILAESFWSTLVMAEGGVH